MTQAQPGAGRAAPPGGGSPGIGRGATPVVLVVAAGAVAGAALAPEPTGTPVADELWSALLVVALALAGTTAAPALLVVAGAAAALLAATWLSLGLAAAAVAAAGARHALPGAPRWAGTGAGALLGTALLAGNGRGPHLAAALTTAVLCATVLLAGAAGATPRARRAAGRAAGLLGGVALVAAAAGVAGAAVAGRDLDRGSDAFSDGRRAARAGDVEAAERHFGVAESAVRAARGPLTGWALPGRAVPGLSQQLRAADRASAAVLDTAAVAREVAADVDLDRLTFDAGRLDLAAVGALEAPLTRLAGALDDTVRRLGAIERRLLVPQLAGALDTAQSETTQAALDGARALRSVQVVPDLLGADVPRRYLVLFTTPVEARNRFGFPGAYAVVEFHDGRFRYERGGPIDELRAAGPIDQAALEVPDRAAPYLGYGASREWRSVTIPPHLPATADLATQMARQVPALGDVDGVAVVGTAAAAEIVDLVGGVYLAEVDTFLDGSNAEEFLTRTQYLEFPELGQTDDRKDLLGDIADLVGQRLEEADLPGLRALGDRFAPLVDAGHLAVSVSEETSREATELLAEIRADGGLAPRAPDVVLAGHVNAGGTKIDLFLRRQLSYEVAIAADGALDATLRVELENGAPPEGLPPYLIGGPDRRYGLVPGVNRTTLLLYSPHELVELALDGELLGDVVRLPDGVLVAHQVPVDLEPGQRRVVEARFRGAVAGAYEVEVLPGGLPEPDRVRITVRDERSGAAASRELVVTAPEVVSAAGEPR